MQVIIFLEFNKRTFPQIPTNPLTHERSSQLKLLVHIMLISAGYAEIKQFIFSNDNAITPGNVQKSVYYPDLVINVSIYLQFCL